MDLLTTHGPLPPGEATTADLGLAEKMVLWSLRMRLDGPAAFEPIREGFRLGGDTAAAETALGAFEPWYLLLAAHCRRNIRLHRPKCPCLSHDERELLDLVAHVQQGDTAGARCFAASLVHDHALVAFLAASLTFGQALACLDLRLRERAGPEQHRLH